MKFRDLPVGATFRFFQRGLLLTKTGDRTYTYSSEEAGVQQAVDPDADVLREEDFAIPEPLKAAGPYGANNKVEIQEGCRSAACSPPTNSRQYWRI
jgi:hypothetical protein